MATKNPGCRMLLMETVAPVTAEEGIVASVKGDAWGGKESELGSLGRLLTYSYRSTFPS